MDFIYGNNFKNMTYWMSSSLEIVRMHIVG